MTTPDHLQARPRRRSGKGQRQDVGSDPDYRFSLANERTFLAWIRTSLALLAGGIAVVQLVPSFGVGGSRHVLGMVLIVFSLVLAVMSQRRWAGNERAMRLGQPLPSSSLSALLAYGLAIVALGSLTLVLLYAVGTC